MSESNEGKKKLSLESWTRILVGIIIFLIVVPITTFAVLYSLERSDWESVQTTMNGQEFRLRTSGAQMKAYFESKGFKFTRAEEPALQIGVQETTSEDYSAEKQYFIFGKKGIIEFTVDKGKVLRTSAFLQDEHNIVY